MCCRHATRSSWAPIQMQQAIEHDNRPAGWPLCKPTPTTSIFHSRRRADAAVNLNEDRPALELAERYGDDAGAGMQRWAHSLSPSLPCIDALSRM